MKSRYPRVSVEFDIREKKGTLERLEVELVSPKQVVKEAAQRPFEQGQKVQWTRTTTGYDDVRAVRKAFKPDFGEARW